MNSNRNARTKRVKFIEPKKSKRDFYINQDSISPKNYEINNPYLNKSLYLNYNQEFPKSSRYNKYLNSKEILGKTNIQCYDYYNNIEKFFKINENIQNQIESIELKNKVNLMKTIIQFQSPEELQKILGEDEELSDNEKFNKKNSKNENLKNEDVIKKNKSKDSMIHDERVSDKKNEKYRKLNKVKGVFDSFDDEEYEDEIDIDYYISPSSYYIKIFDSLIFISSIFYLIFIPYYFSVNKIFSTNYKYFNILLFFIDFIYILDFIINFFRAYHNFEEKLVRKAKYILIHYLKTWFLFDFIQAIPFYSILKYIERKTIASSLDSSSSKGINPFLYILILMKIIKLYKMVKESNAITSLIEILSKNEFFDNYGYFIFSIFFSLCFLNLCACLFIFIGNNSYPGWMVIINIQDESYINIYVSSVYFILVTITTVGYGDITGNSYPEISYQIFLLIIGTIAYSFIISYISSYVAKKSKKSMEFQKNLSILKEIKLSNPLLKDSIYQEVLKNIHNEQLYERKDKSILFDCLPYSLKNKLILEMYKPSIKDFVFFKDIENSDFIVKVVTTLKPLISFKNDILIQEGDFIKEIFFVKKGVLTLNITIDRNNIEESLKKYITINDIGMINITYAPQFLSKNTMNLDDNLNNYLMNNKKKENSLNEENKENNLDIKIIEIRKNEHFGDALMFLNERCPLFVQVKTKIAELLILRKMEVIEIYSIYPNIMKRINKKSLFNMEQIKVKMRRELQSIVNKYCTYAQRNIFNNAKNFKRFLTVKTFKNNESSNFGKNKEIKTEIYLQKKMNENKEFEKSNNSLKKEIKINEQIENSNNKEESENNSNKRDNTINSENNDISNIKDKQNENVNNENDILFDTKIKKQNEVIEEKKTNLSKKDEISESNSNSFSSNSFSSNITNSKEKEIKNNNLKNVGKLNTLPLKGYNPNMAYKSNLSNKSSYSSSSYSKNDLKQNEKLFFPSFSHLKNIKEISFHLDSSYENLNSISNNVYISNYNLQSKTKKYLINECDKICNEISKINTLNKNKLNAKVIITKEKNFLSLIDEIKMEDKIKSVKSFDMSKLNSKKTKKNESSRNLIKRNKSKVFDGLNKQQRCKTIKKRRKSELLANKKLNIITKNINGANKNINNPEEFYADFFKNIISKETSDFNNNNKEEKKNISVNENSVIHKGNNNSSITRHFPKKFNLTTNHN